MLERGLEAGLDVDARDRYGRTGLMLAAKNGERQSAAWLLRHGASLDFTAKYRLSALMLAVLHGQREIVLMLIEAGADPALQGSEAPSFAGRPHSTWRCNAATARVHGATPLSVLTNRR